MWAETTRRLVVEDVKAPFAGWLASKVDEDTLVIATSLTLRITAAICRWIINSHDDTTKTNFVLKRVFLVYVLDQKKFKSATVIFTVRN